MTAFNTAYTNAERNLIAQGKKEADAVIRLGGRTLTVYASDAAKSLAERYVTAYVGTPGTSGTDKRGRVSLFDKALAGTTNPALSPERDRETTIVHEAGLHRSGPEMRAFPNPFDRYTNESAHGAIYDRAASELLEYGP